MWNDQVKVLEDQENPKNGPKCPCVRKKELFSRTTERPAMAIIQQTAVSERKETVSKLKRQFEQPTIKVGCSSRTTRSVQKSNSTKVRPTNPSCALVKPFVIPAIKVSSEWNQEEHDETAKSYTGQKSMFNPSFTSSSVTGDFPKSSTLKTKTMTGLFSDFTSAPSSDSRRSRRSSSLTRTTVGNRAESTEASYTICKSVDNASCFTLPEQKFVTLTHDTSYASTINELDSKVHVLRNVHVVRDTPFSIDHERPFIGGTLKGKKLPLLYTPDEYIEDILAYCYRTKDKYILKSSWVETYVNKKAHTKVVNWLHHLSDSVVPDFETIYFHSVRVFDFSIVALSLRTSYYQLAAICAFWISLKFHKGVISLKVSKIFSWCKGKYSNQEIFKMERRILKACKYNLAFSDPLDYLLRYLKLSNLDEDVVLENGAKFIIEYASLFASASTTDAPLLAAVALYRAYQVIYKSHDVPINFVWYEKVHLHRYAKQMLNVIFDNGADNTFNPVKKYAVSDKKFASKYFLTS